MLIDKLQKTKLVIRIQKRFNRIDKSIIVHCWVIGLKLHLILWITINFSECIYSLSIYYMCNFPNTIHFMFHFLRYF